MTPKAMVWLFYVYIFFFFYDPGAEATVHQAQTILVSMIHFFVGFVASGDLLIITKR